MKTADKKDWDNGFKKYVWGWSFCISVLGYGIGLFKGEDWCVVEIYKLIDNK